MEKTEIIFPSGRTAVQLSPSDGYKYVTNGDVWVREVLLGAGSSQDNWHDTNDEPPTPPDPSEEATPQDYEAALALLGVET